MKFNTFIKKWIIPPGFIELGRSAQNAKSNTQSELGHVETSYLYPFKNEYKNGRCFILATGPSIQNQDLTILEGQYCIAVSMFHLHGAIRQIKPIWHVLAATHPPFKYELPQKFFSTARTAYKDFTEMKFLLGSITYQYSYYNYLTTQDNTFFTEFENRVHFVNFDNSPKLSEKNFMDENVWDLEATPFKSRTVIYSAIQLAYYLGFKEIVLVGCDHDYLTDINRVENHHFYEESKGVSDKDHLSGFDKEKWFFEYYCRWRDYRLMKEFLGSKGVKIINATDGGMLDVFERRELKSLINV